MKICRNLFLTTVSIGCFLTIVDANAKCKACGIGEFLFGTSCYYCRAGCYCTGGNGDTCSLDHKDKINIGQVENYCARKADTCPHKGSDGYGDCGRQSEAQMYRCPSDYPLSKASATSAEQCYWTCAQGTKHAGETLYNKSKSCPNGQYRPKGSNDCKACPDDGKSVCTGTSSFKPLCAGASSDQGIKTCSSGTMPNSSKTSCESASMTCAPGEYMPAGATSCSKCKDGSNYYCPGGGVTKKPSSDMGLKTCEHGTVPNSNKTACVKEKIDNIEPGNYLPGGETQPKPCKTDKSYYCPGGGKYEFSKRDQGIYECPKGARPNSTKTACQKTASKTEMIQCFLTVEDPNKYKSCVTGSVGSTNVVSSTQNTDANPIKKFDVSQMNKISNEKLKKVDSVPKKNSLNDKLLESNVKTNDALLKKDILKL